MKTIAVFAMAHPVLALFGVWAVSGVVRRTVAVATGYDALAIAVDALKAKARAQESTRARA